MGYRHQVISNIMTAPKTKALPEWFKEKYEKIIDFDRNFWAIKTEYIRYGILFPSLLEFDDDVQKVVREMNLDKIKLVYFADESDSNSPDISHVLITKDSITEIKANSWEEV